LARRRRSGALRRDVVLGQGANQSIEDGMALATILAHADRATAPTALLAYERLRRERVAAVQRGARENGMRYDSLYADLDVRDAEITAHAAFRKRLYDHDVVPEAQAAAATLRASEADIGGARGD